MATSLPIGVRSMHMVLSRAFVTACIGISCSSVVCNAEAGPAFSDLPPAEQSRILQKVEAPPLAEREAPYSTPMYYLLAKGFHDGPNKELELTRNRPDWQEAMLRDWAELGLTSSLFLTTPGQWQSEDAIQAIKDYVRLSRKHGLKVAIRLGGDHTFQGIEASGWNVHPKNPDNRIAEYVEWCGMVAEALKGEVDHYIVGDEVNGNSWEDSDGKGGTVQGIKAPEHQRWTAEAYMQVFSQISVALKKADPDAHVSMFGMMGRDWDYVQSLIKLGYKDHGDGVASNYSGTPSEKVREFAQKVHDVAPHFKLYSNGVGYVAAQTDVSFPSNAKGYKRLTDTDQAEAIARSTITMWDSGWDSAPYYIVLRQWQLPNGTVAPHWYGFFGFQDFVIGDNDAVTVKRYPGWYAYQTVAQIFHSKSKSTSPGFDVKSSESVDQVLSYIRNDYECLIALWNDDSRQGTTSVTLATDKFKYPVLVSLYNFQTLTDLPYTVDGNTVTISDIPVSGAPAIIRLVAEE